MYIIVTIHDRNNARYKNVKDKFDILKETLKSAEQEYFRQQHHNVTDTVLTNSI